MRIVDDDVLAMFRVRGDCELCGKRCRVREPHHCFARGTGSASQMDVRCNIVGVGSSPAFQCPCHTEVGDGNIKRERVLQVISKREGFEVSDILTVLWLIKRLPKDSNPDAIALEIEALDTPGARILARRELKKKLE